jgi:hypothetical protein
VEVGKSFGKMAIPLAIGFVKTLFDPLFSASFWKKHWLDTIIAVVSVIPVGRIGGALGKVLEHVPVLKMFSPFLKSVGRLGGFVEKVLGKALKGLGVAGKAFLRGFIEGFDRVFPETSRKLAGKLDDLVVGIFGYAARFGAAGGRVITGMKDGILRGAKGLGSLAGRLAGYAVKPFAKAGSWLIDKGQALVSGLLSGIGKGAVGIGKWLSVHLVKPVVDWVKSLFGIHSPSTVFASIGRQLIAGLLAGITSAALGIGTWLRSHVVSPVLHAFSGAVGWLTGHGKDIVSGLKSGVTDAAKGLGKWAKSHMADPIKNAFSGAGTWLYQHGKDIVSGLLSGIKAGYKNSSGYLGGVAKDGLGSALQAIPGLASGGLARMGTMSLVGERGPELMRVTPQGARVYSNGQSAHMMAAVQGRAGAGRAPAPVVVNVHFNDRRLLDLIDVEVGDGVVVAKRYTDARVQGSAHRATVGRR